MRYVIGSFNKRKKNIYIFLNKMFAYFKKNVVNIGKSNRTVLDYIKFIMEFKLLKNFIL